MFELRDLKAARLWMLPQSAMEMEVALELLCEDRLAHPQWPHVIVVPRLMTHMWCKDLMKMRTCCSPSPPKSRFGPLGNSTH